MKWLFSGKTVSDPDVSVIEEPGISLAAIDSAPDPIPDPLPETPSILFQVTEITGIERRIADLQRQIDAAQVYRKQLYSDLGLDSAISQLDITVVAKPAK